MSLIRKVLTRDEFVQNPPVLVDIGASGAIHKYWKDIAKWSVCIAFDADDRDFNVTQEKNGKYRNLYVYNRLVSETKNDSADFYLTETPHCSSLLKPDNQNLEPWAFAPKFVIKKVVKLKSVDLPSVLKELNINQIDWFKSDSQGIDLRLFKTLDEKLRNKIILAEFEPGILDAYEGEDKMHHVLAFMDQIRTFWLSQLTVKGTQRINYKHLKEILSNKFLSEVSPFVNKSAPGWGEMIFINKFENPDLTKRDFLLGWVIATLQKENGFAYQLAVKGIEKFDDPIFRELKSHSAGKIKSGMITLKYFPLLINKSSRIIARIKDATK